jgi:hypothetical protein
MDYVYICRSGDNEELRYSLRSVAKNAPAGRVWLVGGKPDWYTGNFIPVQSTSSKYNNARNNLEAIVNSEEISDNFVLMNDDFYFMEKVDKVEMFHGGRLIDKITRYRKISPSNGYNQMLIATHRRLVRSGVRDPLDYELHVPMPMDKSGLAKALDTRVLWRSSYGNLVYGRGGTMSKDVKFYGSKSKRPSYIPGGCSPYLSSDDGSFEELLLIIGNQFSERCKYERTDI